MPEIATRPRPTRRAIALLVSAAGFVIGMVVAAALYPGGTWFDASYPGHHLWETFFCDMLHDPALNGEPNPAVPWAGIGLASVVPALGFLWSVLGHLFGTRQRLVRVAQVLGFVGLFGVAAIPLTPSDTYPLAHSLAVVVGGVTSLSAIGITVVGLALSGRRALAALGGLTLALFLVTLGLYVHQGFFGGSLTPALPATQKLAAALAIVWFGAIGTALLRRPDAATA